MKILFAGGGTAGHIYPSIAVAEALVERNEGHEILFIGRRGGSEGSIIENAGFRLKMLEVYGIPKRPGIGGMKKIIKTLASPRAAAKIIKEFSPDVIFATGGYVSYPCIKAGISMKIPTVIHESNAFPGKVTRLLYKKCTSVLLNLDGAKDVLKGNNIQTVGMPLRRDFLTGSREQARRKLNISNGDFLIISFGGSGGSERINDVTVGLMKSYSTKNINTKHIHACGKRYFESYKKNEAELCSGKYGCRIVPYIEDMPTYLLAADLVISRSGAVTLSELCAAGAAAILIPSPNVSDDHQRKNAQYLCDKGAAVIIDESELSERILLDTVAKIRGDESLRQRLCERIGSFKNTSAKDKIINELFNVSKK